MLKLFPSLLNASIGFLSGGEEEEKDEVFTKVVTNDLSDLVPVNYVKNGPVLGSPKIKRSRLMEMSKTSG